MDTLLHGNSHFAKQKIRELQEIGWNRRHSLKFFKACGESWKKKSFLVESHGCSQELFTVENLLAFIPKPFHIARLAEPIPETTSYTRKPISSALLIIYTIIDIKHESSLIWSETVCNDLLQRWAISAI